MKKLMKCMLLLAAMALLLLVVPALADTIASGDCGAEGENVTWTVDNTKVLTIRGNGAMADFETAPWGQGISSINTVVFEGQVTHIGNNAFTRIWSLTNISLPDSLLSIGENAFTGCTSLAAITIPDGVTTIGTEAFSSCQSLAAITIPQSVTSIGSGAFEYCYGLTSIDVPDSLTEITPRLFASCDSLASVSLPSTLTAIGDGAFKTMGSLTEITFRGTVAELLEVNIEDTFALRALWHCTDGDYTFQQVSRSGQCGSSTTWEYLDGTLTVRGTGTISYPNDVTHWDSLAVTDVVIENGASEIGDYTFEYCCMQSISIPESVTRIGTQAFYGCKNLTSAVVPDSVTHIGNAAFAFCGLSDVHVPSGIYSIAQSTYAGNKMTNVTIPEGVSSIGSRAFTNCESLASVTIPGSVTSIGESAFSYCFSLPSITIPEGVTIISRQAFSGCALLASVTIPVSITSIGTDAFQACSNLKDIFYNGTEAQWNEITISDKSWAFTHADVHFYETPSNVIASGYCGIDGNNLSWTLDGNGALIICGNGQMANYSHQNPVPWNDQKYLINSVLFDGNVTSIGDYSFYDCTNLMDITIPGSVTSIGEWAFTGCCLKSVTIPEGVTSIHNYAFVSCHSLKSVMIPGSMTSIGEAVFGDGQLKYVKYAGSAEDWASISIGPNNDELTFAERYYNFAGGVLILQQGNCGAEGDNVTWTVDETEVLTIRGTGAMADFEEAPWGQNIATIDTVVFEGQVTRIGNNAFTRIWSLENITLPGSLISIGDNAFTGCTSLPAITIPNGVTAIGVGAFASCESMTTLTIPASVTSIGDAAFEYCKGLTNIFIPDNVTEISTCLFAACNSLTSVSLPNTLTSIGGGAFKTMGSLTEITFRGTVAELLQINIEDTYSLRALWHCTDGDHIFQQIRRTGECGEHATWEYLDGTLTISGTGSITGSSFGNSWNLLAIDDVMIENGIDAIGDWVFSYDSMQNVTIPASVTQIGAYAFYACENLTNAVVPDSVTSIGEAAFAFCGLTSIHIPIGTNSIESSTYIANKMTSVTIPDGIVSIGDDAFSSCYNLISVTIPASVTSIGERAFSCCAALPSITIPEGVTNIGSEAFSYCENLTNVTVPVSVTSTGGEIFIGCYNLTNVYYGGTEAQWNALSITDSSESIASAEKHFSAIATVIASSECGANGDNVTWTLDEDGVLTISGTGAMADFEDAYFMGDYPWGSNLKRIVIEEGVTRIGVYAFANQRQVTEVSIPASVTAIGDYAFDYCVGLTGFDVAEGNPNYKSENCVLFDKAGTTLIMYPAGSESGTYTIPYGVSVIGNAAFYNCEYLTSIAIPDSVTQIGGYNFAWCPVLNSITIPANVTRLGENVLIHCSSLTQIDVDSENLSYSSVDSVLFDRAGTRLIRYPAGLSGSYTIPAGVSTIGDGAFSGCDKITGVIIPKSVTAIEARAFWECTNLFEVSYKGSEEEWNAISIESPQGNLADVNITYNYTVVIIYGECGANGDEVGWALTENGMLTIYGTGAIRNYYTPWVDYAENITSLAISEGVTSIGNYAFSRCPNLAAAYIPASITIIPTGAFVECTSLTKITLPDGLTRIDQEAFSGCSSLTEISMSASLTTIGDGAFARCSGLTGIEIPANVTGIYDGAFNDCTSLTSITIPASVTTIGESVFLNCTQLESIQVDSANPCFSSIGGALFNKDGTRLILCPVTKESFTISANVTEIDSGAFHGCQSLTSITVDSANAAFASSDGVLYNKNLTTLIRCPAAKQSITIPNSVTCIGESAFEECRELTVITLPDSVTEIGDNAFWECEHLMRMDLPAGITAIPNNAFIFCNDLINVTIPEGVTRIGFGAFAGCANLRNIAIPDSVTQIGAGAFSNCFSLTSFTIPEGITKISDQLLAYCFGLKSVSLPESVTEIYYRAFVECTSLTDVYFGGSEEQWNEIRIWEDNDPLTNVLMHYDKIAVAIIASGNCGANGDNLTWALDSDGVLTISGAGAMANYSQYSQKAPWADCKNDISGVVIETGVTSIGDYAFESCSAITSISIPTGLTSVGDCAFHFCSGLTEITIPDGVRSIGNYAFSGCSGLTSVMIPKTVTIIPVFALAGCANLTEINVSEENAYFSSVDGLLLNKSGSKIILCPRGKAGSYTIPNSVTLIGNDAFSGCSLLTSIVIPDSVITINDSAFNRCSGLRSVSFGDGLTSIGWNAFQYCTGLTEISIPDGVTEINFATFANCTGLTEFVVPDQITFVSPYAFIGCENLDSIQVAAGNTAFTAQDGILMNSDGTEIVLCAPGKTGAFFVPAGITCIGNRAFTDCQRLTSVTIPASVVSIDDEAFYRCTGLVKVTFLGTNTYIANSAFMFCSNPIFFCYPDSTAHNFCKNYNVPYSLMFDAYATDTDLRLPEGLTALEAEAFSGIPNGLSVYIPARVTQIDRNAFEGVTGVTIYGVIGTEAETFAQEKGYPFVPTGIIE